MSGRGRYLTPDEPPVSYDMVRLFIPHEQTWWAIALGHWDQLGYARIFEQTTGVSAEYAARIFSNLWFSLTEREGFMFPSMIVPAGRATAPNDNWLLCDGAAYLIEQYPALYNAIGTTFGDDGEGSFRVPDMRSRKPIGAGQGTGLTDRVLGAVGGAEEHVLIWDEMPIHQHAINNIALGAGGGTGSQYYKFSPTGSTITGDAGADAPHNNMDPWIALNFFIFTGGDCSV